PGLSRVPADRVPRPHRHPRAARLRRWRPHARDGTRRRVDDPPPCDGRRDGDAPRRRLREGPRRDHDRRRGPPRDARGHVMPVFAYRALTNAGRARAGVLAAESARAAWQELRGRGVYPTDVHEHTPATRWIAGRVTAAELAAATRELATLVEAGLPLADALAAVAEQAEHPTLVRALTVAHA